MSDDKLTDAPAGPGDPGVPASPRGPCGPSPPRAPVGPASPWQDKINSSLTVRKEVMCSAFHFPVNPTFVPPYSTAEDNGVFYTCSVLSYMFLYICKENNLSEFL